jgi:hypothetical protein
VSAALDLLRSIPVFVQPALFADDTERVGANGLRRYLPTLTAVENQKGVLDVDTVKGCTLGMRAQPGVGCYGECYANKIAVRYGIDFTTSVSRKLTPTNRAAIFCAVRDHPSYWYRIGTAGEPCHDWDNTLEVCEALHGTGKTAVIITKHWITPVRRSHSPLARAGCGGQYVGEWLRYGRANQAPRHTNVETHNRRGAQRYSRRYV